MEHLDRYQPIPHGTTAQKKSYNRRNQIENLNGILRNKGRPWKTSGVMPSATLRGSTTIGRDYSPEGSDGNDEADPGTTGDEPAPQSEGRNSADRSRDGPDQPQKGSPPVRPTANCGPLTSRQK